MKMITKTAFAALVCTGAFATSALADTIVVNLGGAPIVADGNNQYVDLNQDGATDIILNDAGRFDDNSEVLDGQGGVGEPLFGGGLGAPVLFDAGPSYYSYGSILVDADGDLLGLGSGTSVDANTDTVLGGTWSDTGLAYNVNSSILGGVPMTGDSIYVAAKMDTYEYLADDGCNGCEYGAGTPEYLGTFYSWFELTHGSLILSSFGYGNGLGVAAVTPTAPNPSAVPLPAGLPLLLAGLGAFGLVRSRKTKAA